MEVTILKQSDILHINENTKERYLSRLKKYGIDPKTLGWGNIKDQEIRFQTIMSHISLKEKSVLDIGCGFSDLYSSIISKDMKIGSYTGIDINPEFINICNEKYPSNNYFCGDLLTLNNSEGIFNADVVIMLDLLNFNLDGKNLDYSNMMIDAAWRCTREVLIVDFLSNYSIHEYPREDFVYYHDPVDIIKICSKLSCNFILIHDYPPLPQKEFMIALFR